MQFYVNGYLPGDPRDHNTEITKAKPGNSLPTAVDVLIVGCGPAGLMLAAQLSAFSDITTGIVDQKPGPLAVGQADGISGRSLEIFQALGFSDRVLREAYFLKAISFWRSDSQHPEGIVSAEKKSDGRSAFSEFPHVVLNQARVHDFLLDVMHQGPAQLTPHYGRQMTALSHSPDLESPYPVTALFENDDSVLETVTARFVVGCDGARSAVREAIQVPLHGDFANKAWGVLDLLLITDFPDIRIKTIVQSTEGNVLIIPREGGHLVRFYVELDQLKTDERVNALDVSADDLIAVIKRIMQPYAITVKEIVWWSVYEIGQRLCDVFDNRMHSPPDGLPRILIAGDACHTHSPKAGQGMNVSMHDSFNLGWKLAAVLRGQSAHQLLLTYSDERRAIAQELIDFDKELAAIFSRSPGQTGSSQSTLQQYLVKADGYVSGTQVRYPLSTIVGNARRQNLAEGYPVGVRFASADVIRLVDACPVQLGHVLEADGRWRIIAFADSQPATHAESTLHKLAHFLSGSAASPIRRCTPIGADWDSVIETLCVLPVDYCALNVTDLPDSLWPAKGRYGLRDYEKIFCVDPNQDSIYDLRGISKTQGALLIVRPDQHVAEVLALDDTAGLITFFDAVLLDAH